MVKYKLFNGTNIDEQDEYGNTALMVAINRDYVDIVKLLLFRGALPPLMQ